MKIISPEEKLDLLRDAVKRMAFDLKLPQEALFEMKNNLKAQGILTSEPGKKELKAFNEVCFEQARGVWFATLSEWVSYHLKASTLQNAFKYQAVKSESFKNAFLKKGEEMSVDENGRTGLHRAAILGDLSVVNSLLNSGLNVAEKDTFGRTALSYAVSDIEPNLDLIDLLIARGLDVNSKDKQGRTAVFYAVNPKTVYHLALNGADLLAEDETGLTAFDYFATRFRESNDKENQWHQKCFEALQLCILHQPNLDKPSLFNGQTILHRAALLDESWMMIRLVEHGANLNIKDKQWKTPLFLLVERENPNLEMIWYMARHGADLNVVDKLGKTPVFYAEDKEVLKLLIDLGADASYQMNGQNNAADCRLALARESDGQLPYSLKQLELAEILIQGMKEQAKGIHKDPQQVLFPNRRILMDRARQRD